MATSPVEHDGKFVLTSSGSRDYLNGKTMLWKKITPPVEPKDGIEKE